MTASAHKDGRTRPATPPSARGAERRYSHRPCKSVQEICILGNPCRVRACFHKPVLYIICTLFWLQRDGLHVAGCCKVPSSGLLAAMPSHLSHTSGDRSDRRALRSGSTCGRLQAEAKNTAELPEGSHYGDPPRSQPSSRTQTQQPHRQSTNYDWDTDTSEHS